MEFVVIIRSEELVFERVADAMRVAAIYGTIVFFRTHAGGVLFEWYGD